MPIDHVPLGRAEAVVDIGALVVLLGVITAVKAALLVFVVRVDPRRPPLRDPRVFAVEYAMVLVIPALTWLLGRRGQQWRDLGLTWPANWQWFVAAAATFVGALLSMNAVVRRAGRHQTSPYAAIAGHWQASLVMFVYAVLLVGLVDELTFRGFLLSRTAALFGSGPSSWTGPAPSSRWHSARHTLEEARRQRPTRGWLD